MQEAMFLGHECDGAVWRMEWKALPAACLMLGVMLSQSKYVLAGLKVDVDKIRSNLDLLGGFLM